MISRFSAALIFLTIFAHKTTSDKLVYVQAIWRHGDRAPDELPYPEDPYDEDYWPRGYGMLTNIGMQQLHGVGAFFRQRYVNSFINGSFNYKEVVFFICCPIKLDFSRSIFVHLTPQEHLLVPRHWWMDCFRQQLMKYGKMDLIGNPFLSMQLPPAKQIL